VISSYGFVRNQFFDHEVVAFVSLIVFMIGKGRGIGKQLWFLNRYERKKVAQKWNDRKRRRR